MTVRSRQLPLVWRWVGGLGAVAFMTLVPWLSDDAYVSTVFVSILMFFTLAAIFDFMFGYVGIFNLGMAGFMMVGAYTSGLLSHYYGLSPWLGLFAGGVAALLLGLVAGGLTLHLRGIYLGLTTLFVAEFLRTGVSNAREITRGVMGLSTTPFPEILGFEFRRGDALSHYYLLLVIAGSIYLTLQLIVRSRIGLAFRAIRADELATGALGINLVAYKLFNFAVASFCTGVVGAFYAHYIGILVPSVQEFGVPRTIEILTIAFVGGRGTLWGSLLSALVLIGIQEVFRTVDEWRLVIYGGFLVVVLLAFPRGMAGGVRSIAGWLNDIFARRPATGGVDEDGDRPTPSDVDRNGA